MTSHRTPLTGRLVAVVVALVAVAAALPVSAGAVIQLPAKLHGNPTPFPDFDTRTATVAPSAAQQQAVAALGADVRWNRFGTPGSLINYEGSLGTASGDSAAAAARDWLSGHTGLFRLSSLSSLQLASGSALGDTGRVVTFRQSFGDLVATTDGTLTVGLAGTPSSGWTVHYVSSTLSGDTSLAGPAQLSATDAFLAAAGNLGRTLSVLSIRGVSAQGGWTVLSVPGYNLAQARLTALPMPGAAAVPAFETLVVDLAGDETAFRSYVDARSGKVLSRENIAFHDSAPPAPATFTGTAPFGKCDTAQPIGTVAADTSPAVKSIDLAASFADPSADLQLKLLRNGIAIQAQDTGSSPEAIHYEPAAGVAPGTYSVAVCHLAGSTVPQTGLILDYAGAAAFNAAGAAGLFAIPAKWRVFDGSPTPATTLGYPWNISGADTRQTWCWDSNVAGSPIPGCSEEVKNPGSRAPWDFDVKSNLPTFTTRGNNAISAEAWVATSLSPGATGHRPVSPTRTYDQNGTVPPAEFSNDWYSGQLPTETGKGCTQVSGNPEQSFTPGVGFDINAATVNLFAMHNRMHDWAYNLGFTEENWNAQEDNFGETPPTQENDAVLGDVQEAGADGPTPVLGRTNANMVPLPDGVHPMTNMYLWQPFASTIYVPCVDGDLDLGIIGHEYGHLIENRMIGKGGVRVGDQAGSMGEGYGDLFGMEVLNEYGYAPVAGENPYAIGAYVSGNKQRSIRNYAMNDSPLNFSDWGYDYSTGDEVHADGEIWMATAFEARQALVAKYNPQYPVTDKAVQRECAQGARPAQFCPGNRRWIQLVFDGMLLMPADATMEDARDGMLAADQIRFGGADLNELWGAFARRGLGRDAFTEPGGNDHQPIPDFASPRGSNTAVTFTATRPDGPDAGTAPDPVNATIYVGDFEARISPVADTDPATTGAANLDNVAAFAPGTYRFVASGPGVGHLRFTKTFTKGTANVAVSFPVNLASEANGAHPVGVDTCTPADGSDPDDQCGLIDDTESSAWLAVGDPLNLPSVKGLETTVDLAGGLQTFNRIQVSAAGDPEGDAAGKFTWLRQFELWTCSANCEIAGVVNDAAFTKRYTSAPDAFPGDAPWPVVSQAQIRSFTLPAAVTATHVQLRVVTNQCTGQPQFNGESDSDVANPTDCSTSPFGLAIGGGSWEATAAELQVFNGTGSVK
jgi:hypothetical protein